MEGWFEQHRARGGDVALALIVCWCAASWGACSGQSVAPSSDASAMDAGLDSRDASSRIDSGAGPDAGATPDSGTDRDAVTAPDAAAETDSGRSADTGTPADTGVELPDASETPDAGGEPDAGQMLDAGSVQPDAWSADAGLRDAGRDAGRAMPDVGSPDAGPPDAGSPDSGVDAASPADAGAVGCPYLFCETFDEYPPNAPPPGPWSIDHNPAMQVTRVSTEQAFNGSQSLRVQSVDGFFGVRAMVTLRGAPVFPLPAPRLHGRVMLYVPTTANFVHASVLQVNGTIPGYPGSSGQGSMGLANMEAIQGSYTGAYGAMSGPRPLGRDCNGSSATRAPVGSWVCLGFAFDTANSTMTFSMNGTVLTDISTTRMSTNLGCFLGAGDYVVPQIESFSMGWETFIGDFGKYRTLYLDDLVLDTEPVACP